MDGLSNGITEGEEVGKKLYLPASFTGGPLNKKSKYLDSMALVAHFGRPSLFITVTCNPKWPEITEALLPGQTSDDQPDIVTQVFNAKLKQITDKIFNDGIFGKVLA